MGKYFKGFWGVAFLAVGLIGLTAIPATAQVTIPQGSTINSAYFHVYVTVVDNRPVTIHRITADWGETTATYNNFANSFAAGAEGGFVADALGWKTVDVTSLVQAWVLGPAAGGYANYGIAMAELQENGAYGWATYWSSDWGTIYGDPTLRPKLVITYTPPGGSPVMLTLQRPGVAAEQVVDTYINPIHPDMNFGTEVDLVTAYYEGSMKYSLVRFIFTVTPNTCPGTGTPGYWMNHPEAWPEDSIFIGGTRYDKYVAIELMRMPVANDKTYTMFAALVAAKLNAALGCATVCPGGVNVAATITAADAWLYQYPVGSEVAAGGKTSPWRIGEPLYLLLDAYNNGLLCVPHRD